MSEYPEDSPSDEPSARVSRRSLLALCAGTSTTLAGCSTLGSEPEPTPPPTASAEPPRGDEPTPPATEDPLAPWASEFDRVVDAVEDLGCDPTGETASDAAIEADVGPHALVRFPAGTYRFERGHRFEDYDRLGFAGVGDVSFVPPPGFNDKLLGFLGDWTLFAGIDLDLSARGTTAGVRLISVAGFRLEDVEIRGRGRHPDESVVNAFSLAVRDPAGRGVLRNVVATTGSAIGHYKGGNGRVGIWIGGRHHGEIAVQDCHLAEFGNNGIYGSRCPGRVVVEGGHYRNNNVCGVRLGGDSVVRGTTVEVDLGTYAGPYTRTNSLYDTRAVVVEQGPMDLAGRVLIEDCDVRLINADRSQGGIVVWPTGNGPRVVDCRLSNEVGWVSSIQANAPESAVRQDERGLEVVDTTVTGSGAWGSAIELVERPDSTIEGTTVEQRGASRDGLRLVAAAPSTLTSTAITTTRFPILAVDPEDFAERCLVSVSPDTKIRRTGPDLAGVRSTDIAVGERDSSPERPATAGTDHRCIGDSILDAIEPEGDVAITAIEGDTVEWTG